MMLNNLQKLYTIQRKTLKFNENFAQNETETEKNKIIGEK